MAVNNTSMPAAHEYPLKFLVSIASLKDLAATSLALDLWHHHWPCFILKKLLNFPLPRPIMQIISKRVYSVGLKLNSFYTIWVHIGIFFKDDFTFLRLFDAITYGPDGKICPERTAKKLLTRNDLTHWQKFQIACVYWLEDDIRQIWPSVFYHPHPHPNRNNAFKPFVHYWMAKMRNPSTNSVPNDQNHKLKKMLDKAQDFENWTAWANIFNLLRADQQSAAIKYLAYYPSGMKNMLSKSNGLQADYILSNFPNQIIFGLALKKDGVYAMKIWNLVRDSIEFEKFFEIFKSLLINTNEGQSVLLKIWITAPNRLKREFFNDDKHVKILFESLPEIERLVHHCLDNDESFISKLFSDMPVEMRSMIWHKYWSQIVICSPAKILNRLVSLGLTIDEYNEFVEGEMMNFSKAESIIRYWMKRRLYHEVVNYTKLCSWNEQLVREFRRKIFSKCIPESYFFGFDELIKIGVVIDNDLPNFEAKDVKRTILFSINVQILFKYKLNRGWTKEAISLVDRFLPSARSLREKQLFLDHWRNFLAHDIYKFHSFDVERWKEFLSWWVDNKNDLPMFKKSFPVDEIFDEILLKAVLKLSLRLDRLNKKVFEPGPSSIGKLKEFVDVDNFLMWYFGDVRAVRRYKRNKIPKYREIARLNNLLSINNDCIVNRVIAWFFSYNTFEIRRFKKKSEKNLWVYKL